MGLERPRLSVAFLVIECVLIRSVIFSVPLIEAFSKTLILISVQLNRSHTKPEF